jgi:hypothetical protein
MGTIERPDHRAHIKAIEDFMVADRDADIAQYQAWADEAAGRGDERRRKEHQDSADELRTHRFSWETGGTEAVQA